MGYLSVSEITWISTTRPKEIEEFWIQEYPEIDTASNKIKILESNGYSLVGYFYLNQDSWIENYYIPIEAQFDSFLKRNNNSELAKKLLRIIKLKLTCIKNLRIITATDFILQRKYRTRNGSTQLAIRNFLVDKSA